MSLELHRDVDLRSLNSFGVAARAARLLRLTEADQLVEARQQAHQDVKPLLILGAGSNCLFVKDFSGLVLQVANRGIELNRESGRVTAAAGENWHQLVEHCLNKGLHGLENLALIPGTVGAAPIQNIGAYGVELAEFFVSLRAFDLETGLWREFDREACEFAYRDSFFKRQTRPRYLIWSVTLQLASDWQPRLSYGALREALAEGRGKGEGGGGSDGNGEAEGGVSHRQLFEAVCSIRRSKLPDPASLGNAGSFFKNPVLDEQRFAALQRRFPALPAFPVPDTDTVKLPAAWLLEQAGWKGRRLGKAAVHTEHALVLVNPGEASGVDIMTLARAMADSVQEKFGIELEPEVRLISA